MTYKLQTQGAIEGKARQSRDEKLMAKKGKYRGNRAIHPPALLAAVQPLWEPLCASQCRLATSRGPPPSPTPPCLAAGQTWGTGSDAVAAAEATSGAAGGAPAAGAAAPAPAVLGVGAAGASGVPGQSARQGTAQHAQHVSQPATHSAYGKCQPKTPQEQAPLGQNFQRNCVVQAKRPMSVSRHRMLQSLCEAKEINRRR